MILRTSALWACLLLASASFAQTTHKIKKGETPEAIAVKYGVSKKALMNANPGVRENRLQIGQKLSIPGTASAVSKKTSKNSAPAKGSGSGYAVRNGENDWTIARKFDLTTKQLHAMNPSVRWDRLQVGQKIRVPGASAPVAKTTRSSSAQTISYASKGSIKIAEGDNDWIVARRLGITVAALHKLNPSVNWNRLRPGQTLVAPGKPKVQATQAVAITTKRVKVTRTDVNVRRKPTTNSELITQVDTGKVAMVIDRDGQWVKLRFSGGTEGWVRSDMLKPIKATQMVAENAKSGPSSRVATNVSKRSSRTRQDDGFVVGGGPVSTTALLDTAFKYRGTRYTWGGTTSRGGFDCSGFVGTVYRQHGVQLPRTSIAMSRVGQTVDRSDLKEGDLLFFKTQRGTRVNHVGLYIGGGRFIHASSSGGKVQTDSLSGYYSRRLAGAKRVTGKLAPSKKSHVAKVDEADPVAEPKVAHRDEASVAPVQKRVQLGTDEITQ